MRMNCIRIGAVRLCLGLILGLLLVPAYVVAPVLFAKADSLALAGMLAGEIFHLANMGVLVLGVATALFWIQIIKDSELSFYISKLQWFSLVILVILVAVNAYVIAPMLVDLKAQMGPIDQVPMDHPLRQQFGIWHGVSAILHLLSSLTAVLLVALGLGRPSQPAA